MKTTPDNSLNAMALVTVAVVVPSSTENVHVADTAVVGAVPPRTQIFELGSLRNVTVAGQVFPVEASTGIAPQVNVGDVLVLTGVAVPDTAAPAM